MSSYGDENLGDEYDEELEEIKRRQLEQLRRQLAQRQKEEEEKARREAELMALLRSILEPEALDRINNLRLVKPELANAAIQTILALVRSGRVSPPVSDEVVKSILIELDSRSRRDYEIRFKWK